MDEGYNARRGVQRTTRVATHEPAHLTRAHRSVESTATLGSFTVQDGGGGMIIRPNDTSAGELVWVKHQVKGNGDEVATNVGLGGIEVLCSR